MKQAIWVCLCMLGAMAASGQQPVSSSKPFVLGTTETLWSAQLNEQRVLNIYLPGGYAADTARYPVLYLLDGSADEDFIHIAGLVQFLNMIQVMPNTIVVGIGNVDRRRDFTLPTSIDSDKAAYPTTGGSAKFISFMERDLQPYLKRNYRTNGNTAIIGQSLGGLLASEVLIKKPGLFSNYIIVSPSLWWDAESLLARAAAMPPIPAGLAGKVYISAGNEGKQMENDAKRLADLVRSKLPTGSKLWLVPMPEESHLTILHRSVYKAMELLNAKTP